MRLRFFSIQTFIVACLAVLFVVSVSCRRDKLLTDHSARLNFSTDTLTFDTVFTSIGSAVRSFVVYNKASKPVQISSVRIAGGELSPFRLNVDGVPGKVFTNVRIEAKDSIYIFAAVTVDPTIANNPFVIQDSILFNLNGNDQHVIVNAWGQNAYFHYREKLSHDSTWATDKPHVIIHPMQVDTGVTLTMPAGTHVYVHPDAALFVFGTLKADGTKNDSVVFQGDRLEPYFKDLPGNWGYLYFTPSSLNNQLTHVVVKDALYGVYVDSVATNGLPKVTLSKCVIKNMYHSGMRVYQGSVDATNCLVYNCGDYDAELFNGGTYNFRHCDFVNYGDAANTHQKPSVVLTNYYIVNNVIFPSLHYATDASFTNCIIYGSLDKELAVDSVANNFPFHYRFSHCIVRSTDDLSNAAYYNSVLKNQDPQFADAFGDAANNVPPNYHLNNGSPAIDNGVITNPTVPDDLDDKPRDAMPDIGCYEK